MVSSSLLTLSRAILREGFISLSILSKKSLLELIIFMAVNLLLPTIGKSTGK